MGVFIYTLKKSAGEAGLVILARIYPRRIGRDALTEAIRRNGFSLKNARVAVGRMAKFVDDDGSGRLRLLAPGLKRADEIIISALKAK